MNILIGFLITIFSAITLGLLIWYALRDNQSKQIERSLKLVPIQIRIPPRDKANDVRDTRELIKENISKAEGVFRLLSGIVTKKSILHGYKYVGFEVEAKGKEIFFYAVVPVSLLDALKKALASGYPGIQIEQKNEINIFSKETKLTGVAGGEFVLKKKSFLAINSYQMNEQDFFAGLLSTLSGLEEGEGAAIQILFRPVFKRWYRRARKASRYYLNPNRKYGINKGFSIFNDMINSAMQGDSKEQNDKPSDAIDQEISKLIEDKRKNPCFETQIRVVGTGADRNAAQDVITSIKLGFAQFTLRNSNWFEYKPAKDLEKFVSGFIFRTFPVHKRRTVLSTAELATIFHLPSEFLEMAAPIDRKGMKEVPAPAKMSQEGIIIGTNTYQGNETIIRLSDDDRRRHFYIIGQTGTGKSVFLENCIVQDMHEGRGVAFIDPHGDTAEKLMAKVPPERAKDVIYFNPGDYQYPMGWNIMEYDPAHPEQKDFLVQEAISMLYKIYDPNKQGFMGPRFEAWFRNAALTVMADPEGGTFIEIPKVFTDDEYLKKKFKHVKDPVIQDFWTGEMAQTDAHSKSEMLGWFVSKFGAFANNEIMRNIVGQKKSAFDLRQIMDEGKILFVNLSKGLLGDINSQLLGIMFIIKFQVAAMSRADTDPEKRRDYSVYIDEFQNYSTDSIATILSEARKYRLSMFMANQFISQLDEKVRDSVFGNVGSMISFRVGPEDAEFLVKQFAPIFDESDLINIPNLNAVAKIINEGFPSTPFTLKELFPPIGKAKPEILEAMIDLSRANYAKPKAQVADEISKNLGI